MSISAQKPLFSITKSARFRCSSPESCAAIFLSASHKSGTQSWALIHTGPLCGWILKSIEVLVSLSLPFSQAFCTMFNRHFWDSQRLSNGFLIYISTTLQQGHHMSPPTVQGGKLFQWPGYGSEITFLFWEAAVHFWISLGDPASSLVRLLRSISRFSWTSGSLKKGQSIRIQVLRDQGQLKSG